MVWQDLLVYINVKLKIKFMFNKNYYYKHLNEGFNILNNRTLVFTDEYEDILNTSLTGEPTIFSLFSEDLNEDITVLLNY